MVETKKALEALVERARAADVVAIDTEFVWERTYYPRLGLIQVGLGDDDVQLIDTVTLTDVTPLGALLADSGVVKIVHDAIQDLTILRRATGAAALNVYDSQRASGFVGLSGTISLQDLVTEAVGVTLRKGETRTDWCKRPLSEKQIDYATDDVRYMPAIHAWLSEKAAAKGRAAWVAEEMRVLDDALLYDEPDPRVQFERVKARGVGGLSDTQRAVLRELTAWREETARSSDRTRRGVLSDDALVEIARRLPANIQQLSKRTVTDREREMYGAAIVGAVQVGLVVPPRERPRRPAQNPHEERISARVQVVLAAIAGRCARQGIDPRLVATKAEIHDVVASNSKMQDFASPILSGWRRTFIGNDILALLAGKAAVALGGHDDWPDLTR